jgi:LytS/YehU family sensor histidine kinase
MFFGGYFMLNLVTYFGVLAAYYGREYFWRHREGELRAARLEASTHRARLAALRMELNPHFLFNTLNAVAGLVRRRDNDGAVRMLARLAELLRATLENGSDPEVPLEKELELLSTYLAIERIRFGPRLDVAVAADGPARTAMVPPMILQPLVENAVKHGVACHTGSGSIRVQAVADGDDLVLSVTNTGPLSPAPATATTATAATTATTATTGTAATTATPAEPASSPGIGLANTRQRLTELYGSRAALTLEALEDGGAIAIIRLPLHGEMDVATAPEPLSAPVRPAAVP